MAGSFHGGAPGSDRPNEDSHYRELFPVGHVKKTHLAQEAKITTVKASLPDPFRQSDAGQFQTLGHGCAVETS